MNNAHLPGGGSKRILITRGETSHFPLAYVSDRSCVFPVDVKEVTASWGGCLKMLPLLACTATDGCLESLSLVNVFMCQGHGRKS